MQARQRVQPTGPNRPSGSIPQQPPTGQHHAWKSSPATASAVTAFPPNSAGVGWQRRGPASRGGERCGPPTQSHNTRTTIPPRPITLDRVDWTTWWPWRGARTRSHPELGRENPQRPWYCASRHGRVGRRQVLPSTLERRCQSSGFRRRSSDESETPPARKPPRERRNVTTTAGWSSPVARQAHNLKVTGSNPVPATPPITIPHHRRGRAFLWRQENKGAGHTIRLAPIRNSLFPCGPVTGLSSTPDTVQPGRPRHHASTRSQTASCTVESRTTPLFPTAATSASN